MKLLPDARGRFFLCHFAIVSFLGYLFFSSLGGNGFLLVISVVFGSILTLPTCVLAIPLHSYLVDPYLDNYALGHSELFLLICLYAVGLAANSWLWAYICVDPSAKRGVFPQKKRPPPGGRFLKSDNR